MTEPTKKTALLVVDRANQGEATYHLFIDGVEQTLSSSTAKWDDASPWPAGDYDLSYTGFEPVASAFGEQQPKFAIMKLRLRSVVTVPGEHRRCASC